MAVAGVSQGCRRGSRGGSGSRRGSRSLDVNASKAQMSSFLADAAKVGAALIWGSSPLLPLLMISLDYRMTRPGSTPLSALAYSCHCLFQCPSSGSLRDRRRVSRRGSLRSSRSRSRSRSCSRLSAIN